MFNHNVYVFLKISIIQINYIKKKQKKQFVNFLVLIFLIIKYQYNYFDKHKGIKGIIFSKKVARKNLFAYTVFRLYVVIVKDSNINSLLPQKVELLYLSKFNGILYFIGNKDWKTNFLKNEKEKEKLNKKFFS